MLLANATKAPEGWLVNDWKNPNWYDNEIGVPRALSEIALLLTAPGARPIPTADAAKMTEIMSRADWKGNGNASHPQWTGANLLDMLLTQVYRGLFTRDTKLVAEGFSVSFGAVVRHHQSDESIQVDNSFHQHGPQLLSAAYGAVFTHDILNLAHISGGTAFAMPTPAIDVFEGLVLDGQARMSRAGSFDWQVCAPITFLFVRNDCTSSFTRAFSFHVRF